ncbi:MAG TPA: MBL fold metallo-hydrolase [Kiloniellaceae bacterium]
MGVRPKGYCNLQKGSDFFVRFWGTRGSIPCPGESYTRYGGNTSCIEVRCGDKLLIFDAGTGLRPLGKQLCQNGALEADIFLTHTHHDHIVGLPFFAPLFDKRNRIRLWAGHLVPELTLHDVLVQFMNAPLFPVPPKIFAANVSFHDFTAGDVLEPKLGVRLITAPLNHPNGATGYRVDFDGRALCYVTDTEHEEGRLDRNVLELIDGADLVIYDSTYTDDEFAKYRGWGHSTWQEGVRLCDKAAVRKLVLFHHDPSHDDAFMDRVAREAESARPGTVVAREGLLLEL